MAYWLTMLLHVHWFFKNLDLFVESVVVGFGGGFFVYAHLEFLTCVYFHMFNSLVIFSVTQFCVTCNLFTIGCNL